MNIEGLQKVLTKYLGTEVVVGPKRGARAEHDHVPQPSSDVQFNAQLTIENTDSPGRPDVRRVFNTFANKLVVTITTGHVAKCGLRVICFKGSDPGYPQDLLSRLRGKFYTDECQEDLRNQGFGLADIGQVHRINAQAGDVGYLDFTVVYSEEVPGNPELDWIDNIAGSGTVSGGGSGTLHPTL